MKSICPQRSYARVIEKLIFILFLLIQLINLSEVKEKPNRLTMIIPAYNEGDTIGTTLSQLLQTMEKQPLSYEIIVVDDGSLDGTGVIAKEKGANVVIRNFHNAGKGAAIASGVSASSGSIIVLMDADGTFNPKDIPNLVSPILNGNADIVFGTSFDVEKASFLQFFANCVFSAVSKLLFGIKTTSYIRSGLRAFNADKFKELIRSSYATSGFEFDLRTISFARNKGYRIFEVPLKTRLRMSVGYSQPKLISSLNLYRALLRAYMSSLWSENK